MKAAQDLHLKEQVSSWASMINLALYISAAFASQPALKKLALQHD
jgi:hypothetical protein